MIKMRMPAGRSFFSLHGRPVDAASDGSVMVHPIDIETMRTHGCVEWDADEIGGDVDKMSRAELITAAMAHVRQEMELQPDEELRQGIASMRERNAEKREAAAREAELTRQPVTVEDQEVTEASIAEMTKEGLFAYLRGEKVAVGPATGIDKLRDIALDTLRKSRAQS